MLDGLDTGTPVGPPEEAALDRYLTELDGAVPDAYLPLLRSAYRAGYHDSGADTSRRILAALGTTP